MSNVDDAEISRTLKAVSQKLEAGASLRGACDTQGISEETYFVWRRNYTRVDKGEIAAMQAMEKKSRWLSKMVADLTLEKLAVDSSMRPETDVMLPIRRLDLTKDEARVAD